MPNGMYGGVRGGLNSPYSIVLIIRDSGCWAGFGSGPRVLGLIRGCQTWSLAIWPKFCCLMEDGLIESYRNWGDRTNIRLRSILSNGNLI